MNPQQPTPLDKTQQSPDQNLPHMVSASNSEKDEKYAQALASMAVMESQMQEKQQPATKHFISRKTLIYIVLSLIVSIIGLFISKTILSKSSSPNGGNGEDTVKQLLDTTKEVKDLQNP